MPDQALRVFKSGVTFAEPTKYLAKRGIKKVGYYTLVTVEREDNNIKLCGGDKTEYHYDSKIEEFPSPLACFTIPASLWSEVKELLKEL